MNGRPPFVAARRQAPGHAPCNSHGMQSRTEIVMTCSTRLVPRATTPRLADIREKLNTADSMLDHGLKAIHSGSRLDAMETVYAASCLIEEIMATLETPAAAAETRTSC
jgi:hypothetical protein